MNRIFRTLRAFKLFMRQEEPKTVCSTCDGTGRQIPQGEVLIEQIPLWYRAELLHLISRFGDRAADLNPEDLILTIEAQNEHALRVTTTEDQTATKLAKEIRLSFNTERIAVSQDADSDNVRHVWVKFNPLA